MKEMVYGRMKEFFVLYSGEYKEHKFAIINLGKYPTAYIENKIDVDDCESCLFDNINVHGGFNFCRNGYWTEQSKKISWLGWDYGHLGDYCGYLTENENKRNKKWTTNEIFEEVKYVIDQIIKIEKENELKNASIIKVGDKVVITDVEGKEWKGTIINISDYRLPEMKYCLDIDGYDLDYVFVGKDKIKILNEKVDKE